MINEEERKEIISKLSMLYLVEPEVYNFINRYAKEKEMNAHEALHNCLEDIMINLIILEVNFKKETQEQVDEAMKMSSATLIQIMTPIVDKLMMINEPITIDEALLSKLITDAPIIDRRNLK